MSNYRKVYLSVLRYCFQAGLVEIPTGEGNMALYRKLFAEARAEAIRYADRHAK
jgi:hypothetical protein